MHIDFPQNVLFKHCDPAGIAFYPRLFEMINDAVENAFSNELGWPFEAMHPHAAVPTAEFNVRFKRACRHGDQLVLRLEFTRLGRTSLSLTTRALRGDELRFEADQVLVCVDGNGRPAAWPQQVTHNVNRLMEDTK